MAAAAAASTAPALSLAMLVIMMSMVMGLPVASTAAFAIVGMIVTVSMATATSAAFVIVAVTVFVATSITEQVSSPWLVTYIVEPSGLAAMYTAAAPTLIEVVTVFGVTAIAALVFPYRKRARGVWESSPYKTWKLAGIPVITIGAGWVASIAVPILLGGAKGKRYSLPNTRFLLHQPNDVFLPIKPAVAFVVLVPATAIAVFCRIIRRSEIAS